MDIISTFTKLIPKKDNLESFDDFRLISLCNHLYKIIAKTIATWITRVFFDSIYGEKFMFLNGRWMLDAMGVAPKGIN
jgi:hypothetical protein